MADTYTSRLGFQQPQVNADAGTWGGFLNTDLQAIDDAVSGIVAINIAGLTTYTLTAVPGSEGAAYQQRFQTWDFTGALTGDCTVTIAGVTKTGYAINNTTGGHNVILTTGFGSNLTLTPGALTLIFCDSADVSAAVPPGSFLPLSGGTITGNLTVDGTTSSHGTLTVGSTGQGTVTLNAGIGNPGYVGFFNSSGTRVGYAGFQSASGYLTLESENGYSGWSVTGNLIVNGRTTISGPLEVNGSQSESGSGLYITGAGSFFGAWGPVNSAVNTGSGLVMTAAGFYSASDRRGKSDIADISPADGADWVTRGRPRTFIINGQPRSGFIAQEDVASGRGAAVSFIADSDARYRESDGVAPAGHRLTRDYEHDIAYLTAALQAALARIAALEARL